MQPTHDTEPEKSGSNEWHELRGHARHQTVEVLRLIMILLQDAVILVAGFVAEFVYEHWLHSEHPFFQLALNLSSAFFLLLYVITVTVHVVQYVRGQVGATKPTRLGEYLHWAIIGGGVLAAAVALTLPRLHLGDAPTAPQPVTRLTLNLPPNQHLAALDQPAIAISPDGKNIVYVAAQSDPSRDREGAVNPGAATSSGKQPLPSGRGSDSSATQQLYLRPLDSQESKPIAGTEGGFSAGKPKMLFDGPYLPTSASFPWYDVSPDGQRFLMLKPVESQATASTQINVVLNWFEELKKKSPVK